MSTSICSNNFNNDVATLVLGKSVKPTNKLARNVLPENGFGLNHANFRLSADKILQQFIDIVKHVSLGIYKNYRIKPYCLFKKL